MIIFKTLKIFLRMSPKVSVCACSRWSSIPVVGLYHCHRKIWVCVAADLF